jgi:diketogulonate reductase-like aldo/keto reductase
VHGYVGQHMLPGDAALIECSGVGAWPLGEGPLDIVRRATARKAQIETADRDWREAIQAAIKVGERVVDIAEAAGVSAARVYQIRDGVR